LVTEAEDECPLGTLNGLEQQIEADADALGRARESDSDPEPEVGEEEVDVEADRTAQASLFADWDARSSLL
jgi:hypothetical protein